MKSKNALTRIIIKAKTPKFRTEAERSQWEQDINQLQIAIDILEELKEHYHESYVVSPHEISMVFRLKDNEYNYIKRGLENV